MSIGLHLGSEFRRRWLILLAGYVAASLVGGAAVVLMLLLPWNDPLNIDTAVLSVASLLVLFVSLLVFVFALGPTILMLIYAVRHSVHSPAWYALAGMAIAVLGSVLHLLFSLVLESPAADGLATSIAKALFFEAILTLPAGLCAGLTFWTIAGRRMGEKT